MFFRRPKKTVSATATIENDLPDEHRKIVEQVRFATMTSDERLIALCQAIKYVCSAKIEGDIVECGVWKGGSMMAAAHSLQQELDYRRIWLFDTFCGMSEPTSDDVDYLGNEALDLMRESDRNQSDSIWCNAALDEVKLNMASTNYPNEVVNYVVGPVEETLDDEHLPETIALLRLDTDWYESTKKELEVLFPRLSDGGVLIIDDYGHWNGCRKAVDEYFEQRNIHMLLNRIDYTGRVGVKLPAGKIGRSTVAA